MIFVLWPFTACLLSWGWLNLRHRNLQERIREEDGRPGKKRKQFIGVSPCSLIIFSIFITILPLKISDECRDIDILEMFSNPIQPCWKYRYRKNFSKIIFLKQPKWYKFITVLFFYLLYISVRNPWLFSTMTDYFINIF